LTKPLQGMAFKKMRAHLMNCSVDYEENKEKEMSSIIELLTGRGPGLFQTPQECVGSSRKLQHATDRHFGVSRILKQSSLPNCRRGRV
jgi:hypothetical protein